VELGVVEDQVLVVNHIFYPKESLFLP
jgi:hypothetical protein